MENIDNVVAMSDADIHKVYAELDKENHDKEILAKAQEETENTEYDNITPIEQPVEKVQENDGTDQVKLTTENLQNSIKDVGINLSDEDTKNFALLMLDYRKDKSITLYDKLPAEMRRFVDNNYELFYREFAKDPRIGRTSRESIARFVVGEMLKDTEIEESMKELDMQLSDAYSDLERDMHKIINEGYEELFSSIDELRETNPEKADALQAVKDAFANAQNFDKQIECLNNMKPRDLRKLPLRYNSEVSVFNKKVNNNKIQLTVPDLNQLYDIIKLWLPQYSKDQIHGFIVLIIRSMQNLDFNTLADTAYAYKFIDNIYKYKMHSPVEETEDDTKFFKSISDIIDSIAERKNIYQSNK